MLGAMILIDVGGLVLGALWLARAPSRLREALRFVAWGLFLGVVAAGAALVLDAGAFGVMRLWCHVLFCVLAPLLMLWGAGHLLRRTGPALGAGLVMLGLAMTAVYAYARRVEPFDLRVTRHTLEPARLDALEGRVRVVLLADLQTDDIGAYEEGVFRRIDELAPDLLLLAGDYIQVFGTQAYTMQASRMLKLVRGMRHRPRLGAFAVMGDTDPDPHVFAGTRVRMLQGEVVTPGDVPLQVMGLRYEETFDALTTERLDAISDFEGFTIVLGHRPDFMAAVVARGGSDVPFLGLAGHTHGGQIVVPGFGPPLTLSRLPRRYASGFHRLGEAWLCVSRGVGLERLHAPRIRLFCPPELVVIDLVGRPSAAR